jgi:hypothetical protein
MSELPPEYLDSGTPPDVVLVAGTVIDALSVSGMRSGIEPRFVVHAVRNTANELSKVLGAPATCNMTRETSIFDLAAVGYRGRSAPGASAAHRGDHPTQG